MRVERGTFSVTVQCLDLTKLIIVFFGTLQSTYMALSSAPLFLAKLPVGFLSGYLLERYCPEEGERHSQTMWLIIGLLTATSPVLLTVLWGYVSKKDEEEDQRYTELSAVYA